MKEGSPNRLEGGNRSFIAADAIRQRSNVGWIDGNSATGEIRVLFVIVA